MKRISPFFALLLLGCATILAQDLTVSYRFEEPRLVKGSGGTVQVAAPGFVAVAAPGDPLVPSFPAKILLPQGFAVASVDVSFREPVLLGRGLQLDYFRGNFPTGRPAASVTPNRAVYNLSGPYPAERVVLKGVHDLKGYTIALVDLQPIFYIPARGELYWIPEMKARIRLQPVRGTVDTSLLRNLAADRDEVAQFVDNPEQLAAYRLPDGRDRDTAYQYLIVTNSALQANFQTLANHKAAQGLSTHIELIANVYSGYTGVDNAEKLRNYIRWAYQNHGTEYVVLGGDSEIIPYRGCYGAVGDTTDSSIPTDFYFAELSNGNWNADGDALYGEPSDNVDLFAEVGVGRISASTTTEAANQINKIISYENSTPPYTALLLGETLDADTEGGDSKDVVEQEMGGIATSKLYDSNGAWSASTLINTYFNTNNTHIVNHLGHANDTYDLKMYNSDVGSLTNTVPFFIYSQGCYPGNFPVNDICFAEKITTGTANGAFAVIMNSRYGWYAAAATNGTSNIFDWEFMESVFEQFQHRLGPALNDSRHKLANYAASDPGYRWVYYELTLFGCPATPLHWNCAASTARIVPHRPADNFTVMQGDSITLTIAAHSNCATPLVSPVVTALVSTGRGRETVVLHDDGVAPDTAAGDGFFSGGWAPADIGPATITYTASGTGLNPAQSILAGEVVESMIYHQSAAAMNWIDAASGTSILAGEDDAGELVEIGFPFKYYGKTYTQTIISSNGLLRFESAYNWDAGDTVIPNEDSPNAVIAALWTDLKLNTSAHVYYTTTGSAPSRKFVAEWSAIPHYDNVGAATFEIVLEESTNNIYVYYQDTDFGNASYNAGADATAGIEDYNGWKGIQYAHDQASLPNGLAILYSPVDGPVMALTQHVFSGGNGDGILDQGETLDVALSLYNAGNQTGHGVQAVCRADNGVTFGVDTQNFGDLAAGASATRTFTFTIPTNIGCGSEIRFDLDIACTKDNLDPVQNYGAFTSAVGDLVDLVTMTDAMEGGVNGWTTQLDQGLVNWGQVTTSSHSPTHSWFTPNQDSVKDNSLISPVFTVPVNGLLTFWHSFNLESGYDGGVLEIRPEGGAWVTNVEGLLVGGGYTHTLSTCCSNPLPGRRAWSGNSNGYIQTVVDLSAYTGQQVQARFRQGSDSSIAATGWYIDDVEVAGFEYQCPPTGDIDASGAADCLDLVILLNTLAGNVTEGQAPCTDPAAGDFNHSGHLDSSDCLALCRLLSGNP